MYEYEKQIVESNMIVINKNRRIIKGR